MTRPGQPGSQNPAGAAWMVTDLRALRQELEQIRGQLSRLKTIVSAAVTNVAVSGSGSTRTLTVTFGNGTTRTYPLP